jgi:hypothetical protein
MKILGGGGSVSIPIHRVTTTPSTVMRTPEPRLPRYIYWDPSTKQWLFATQVKIQFLTLEYMYVCIIIGKEL